MNQRDRMPAMVTLVAVTLMTVSAGGAAAGQARMAFAAGGLSGSGPGGGSATLLIVRALPEPILHAREVVVPVAADRLSRASWRLWGMADDWRSGATDEVPSTFQPPSVAGPEPGGPSRAVLRDASPLPDAGEVL